MTARTCPRCRSDVTRTTLVRCKDGGCPLQREREVATIATARFAMMFLAGGLLIAALVAAVGWMLTHDGPADRSDPLGNGGFASARAPEAADGWLARLSRPRNADTGSAGANQVVSFSCADPNSATRRLICGDASLAQYDYNLGLVYGSVMARAADPARLAREQQRWLSELDALGDDSAAIAEHYRARLAQLTRA